MKTCPYCGTEHPEDASICPTDGQPLTKSSDTSQQRKKITGVYGYADSLESKGLKPVPFTLRLEQGWLGHFTGNVTKNAPDALPGTGVIDGYFVTPKLEFAKQMPVGYGINADGHRVTLREYVIAEGFACDHDLPASPVAYAGTFLDANRVQGTWTINPRQLKLAGAQSLTLPPASGYWCAEFVTSDLKANPTGGPTEPLFDPAALPPLDEPEADSFHLLGKFDVMEAEGLLKKLEQAGLRFEINQDDSPIKQMPPFTEVTGGMSGLAQTIEIFIHPEDELQAAELMGTDHPI
jgi:hypothetical protein